MLRLSADAYETAKFNSLDSEAYIPEVLARIAVHSINRIHEILPRNLNKGSNNVR